jgi:hypothetical protein
MIFNSNLSRKTPLRSKSQMKRSPLRRVSAKKRRDLAVWKEVTKTRAERVGHCELYTPVCPDKTRRMPVEEFLGMAVGHHWLPQGQGGADTYENCRVAHPICHDYAHRNPKEAYEKGWICRKQERGAITTTIIVMVAIWLFLSCRWGRVELWNHPLDSGVNYFFTQGVSHAKR